MWYAIFFVFLFCCLIVYRQIADQCQKGLETGHFWSIPQKLRDGFPQMGNSVPESLKAGMSELMKFVVLICWRDPLVGFAIPMH